MKKEVKQFLIKKRFNKWVKENKQMVDDILELHYLLLMLEVKWGLDLEINPKPAIKIKGRNLGIGVVEKLFNAQEKFNNLKK